MPVSSAYKKAITIPESAIDANGHVNNVAYVQWMQDIAVEHYSAIGGIEAQGADFTWVIREHRIEYFLPAFLGEEIEIRTWSKISARSGRCVCMNLSAKRMEKL